VARDRAAGLRVVLTNGVFDLLHVGHVAYLEAARALGDRLVVGVNGDAAARRLKGPGRPLQPARERARLLAALRCVDYVTVFPEMTASALLRAVRPHVYAKGADYASKPWPEAAEAQSLGIEAALLPLTPGRSTSALLDRLRAAPLVPRHSVPRH
jgi:rfaE bifunctional protein nucleotidyltransferase chain/domain